MNVKIARRRFLAGAVAAAAAPMVIPASALGRDGRAAASNRIVMGGIGMGGRGTGVLNSFANSPEVQVVAVCDVSARHRERAKQMFDNRYGNTDCRMYNDFREVNGRSDVDAVMIATPDHWHAVQAIDACRNGKDVFCEKPETLTIREGQAMIAAARDYGRVFSGGSQRVWEDYHWFHRMVRGGAIGELREIHVNVGGPANICNLPEEPVPEGLDWDLWLGPAPWAPFHRARLNYRAWRDYSGGGMTDWGAHGFGGALFAAQLDDTGPVEILPPDGGDVRHLTFVFANGVRMYHGGSKAGILTFRGTEGEICEHDRRRPAPNIVIPNYRGRGGINGDFLHCVKTRQLPFRDIAIAHRTVTVCHLGNIAYWLNRPIRWDPVREEIIGDEQASRWLSRPMRAPWTLA
jgi:hypothetical protein